MIPDNFFIDGSALFPTRGIKARHNKRRIVQVPFAELVLSKLKLGGVFPWRPTGSVCGNHMLKSCLLLSTGTKICQEYW